MCTSQRLKQFYLLCFPAPGWDPNLEGKKKILTFAGSTVKIFHIPRALNHLHLTGQHPPLSFFLRPRQHPWGALEPNGISLKCDGWRGSKSWRMPQGFPCQMHHCKMGNRKTKIGMNHPRPYGLLVAHQGTRPRTPWGSKTLSQWLRWRKAPCEIWSFWLLMRQD